MMRIWWIHSIHHRTVLGCTNCADGFVFIFFRKWSLRFSKIDRNRLSLLIWLSFKISFSLDLLGLLWMIVLNCFELVVWRRIANWLSGKLIMRGGPKKISLGGVCALHCLLLRVETSSLRRGGVSLSFQSFNIVQALVDRPSLFRIRLKHVAQKLVSLRSYRGRIDQKARFAKLH